jgi:ABC-type sugar transport system permease subunit
VRIFEIGLCAYLLIGVLISMLMDHHKKLAGKIFFLGVLFWPIVLPIAVVSGIREIRRRHGR